MLLYPISSFNLQTYDLNQNTVEQGARELTCHSLVCYFKSKNDSSNTCGAGGVGKQPRENSTSTAVVRRLPGAEDSVRGFEQPGCSGKGNQAGGE